jgi:hypothetical protein
MAAARRAVDDDDYASAVVIAGALTAAEARAIGRRIANRLARRALAAVRAGDRRRARAILIEARAYPRTSQVRFARARYKAAKRRAAGRRQQRRVPAYLPVSPTGPRDR